MLSGDWEGGLYTPLVDRQSHPCKNITFPCAASLAGGNLSNTGWERLIRSHSSARFCFELSGNSNYQCILNMRC